MIADFEFIFFLFLIFPDCFNVRLNKFLIFVNVDL